MPIKNDDIQRENDKNTTPDKTSNSLGDYFSFGEVFGYFFRKKDPDRPKNFNLSMMHGINKISILMFLGALIFWIIKRIM